MGNILKAFAQAQNTLAKSISESVPEASEEQIRGFSISLLYSLYLVSFCETRIGLDQSGLKDFLELNKSDIYQRCLSALLSKYDSFFSTSIFRQPLNYEISLKDRDLTEVIQNVLNESSALTPEILGMLYEKYVCPHDVKKEGIFYTPLPVVKEMVENSISKILKKQLSSKSLNISVLDPACGSGIFLLESFRYLISRTKTAEELQGKINILLNCIFGVDKDPQAVSITRLILQLALFENQQLSIFDQTDLPDLSENILIGNSLLEPSDFDSEDPEQLLLKEKLGAFNWPKITTDGGFDCIIGNPPYGLSRNEQLSKEENKKLKQVYQEYRAGKVNKYLLFMAKSYQLLAKGGLLSFIVPNAWLGIRAGKLVRKKFLEERSLSSILVYDCPVFDVPSVETVVFQALKNKNSKRIRITRVDSLKPNSNRSFFDISADFCLGNPEHTIPVIWNDHCEEIIDHLLKNSLPLGSDDSPFIPSIALQAYAKGKGTPPQTAEDVKNHIFHSSEKTDPCAIPYLEGSDITRYELNWSGKYLKHGPWLAEPQTLDRFICPRILLREIINPVPHILNACFTSQPYLYNKSVLHILPRKGASQGHMLALLAILNSKLASFVIRFRGRKSQRRIFPKIVNADLKDFPLPILFMDSIQRLAHLAEERTKTLGNSDKLQDEIDQAVFDMYKVPEELVRNLKQSLEIS